MKELFSALLRDWAQPVSVLRGTEQISTRAFVQPVRSAARHEKKGHPLGLQLPGEAVYIGPADLPVDGSSVLCAGVRWRVRRTEEILVGSDALYTWAALTREGEEKADV